MDPALQMCLARAEQRGRITSPNLLEKHQKRKKCFQKNYLLSSRSFHRIISKWKKALVVFTMCF